MGIGYLINNKEEIFATEINFNDFGINDYSLFDGELIYIEESNKYEYHIFDVLFLNAQDLRHLPFYSKDELAFFHVHNETKLIAGKMYYKTHNYYYKNELIDDFNLDNNKFMSYSKVESFEFTEPITRYGYILYLFAVNKIALPENNIKILYKSFYPLNLLYNLSEKYRIIEFNTKLQYIKIPNTSYNLDGLIIQDMDGQYPIQIEKGKNPQWNNSYKWKFANSITIDFKITGIIYNDEKTEAQCNLCDNFGTVYVIQNFPLKNGVLLSEDGTNINPNEIIECNFIDDKWNLMRIRHDKLVPNAPRTIKSTIELIKNPVNIEDLL